MARKGHALDNTLTQEEYERLLLFCASLADEEKSVETFFYHLMVGYGRMRPGTLCHYHPDWYDPEREVIQVPGFWDCDCCDCRQYARQRAAGENEDRDYDELIELYWNGKEEKTARAIPLKTERQVEIVEKFNQMFGDIDKPVGCYEHVRRRLTRTVELIDGVIDPETYKLYINRATAVTHFAWAGMDDSGLTFNFGWADEGTIKRYRARSGTKAAEAMDEMYGRGTTENLDLDGDPPTWSDYREASDERIEVDIWTPKTAGDGSLPPEKEEEALKNNTLQRFMEDGDDTADNAIEVGGYEVDLDEPLATERANTDDTKTRCLNLLTALPWVGVWLYPRAKNRFIATSKDMRADPELIDPNTPRGVGRFLLCSALFAVMFCTMLALGFSTLELGATVITAVVISVVVTDIDPQRGEQQAPA